MKNNTIINLLLLAIIILTIVNSSIGISYVNKYDNLKKEHEQLLNDYNTLKINYEDLIIDCNNFIVLEGNNE